MGSVTAPFSYFAFEAQTHTILDTLQYFLYSPLWRSHSFPHAGNFIETHSLKILFESLIYANISPKFERRLAFYGYAKDSEKN